MNRAIYILLLCVLCGYFAVGAELRVGKQQRFKTIAEAIRNANDKDTIWIEKGVYYEKGLTVDKQVVLIGINYPVLDGEHKYQNISVKADNVTIAGFEIRNSGISSMIDFAGIKVYDSHHVTIVNNILVDCFFGVYLQNCINCAIRNNKMTAHQVQEQQSGNGVHCWKGDSIQVIGNTITGHRDGIYFEFVYNSIIWRNISVKNIRYGLHFMFSNHDTYAANIFENNGAGVSVMFSNYVKMFHNYFIENWGDGAYGILLKEISDSYIDGNYFEHNTSSIFMEGVSRVTMINNNFKNNGWGLKIQSSCMDITLTNNNFRGNTFDVGTSGTLVLNTFDNNYWDKYEGYDLDKDNIGDVPFRPVSMFSMVVDKNPPAMMLFRSLITTLLDRSERVIPSLTPENLKDNHPLMKPIKL